LVKLFVILWLCVALALLINPEVWPHGPVARAMAAAPPIVPLVFLAWGKAGPAIFTLALTALVVAAWVTAARHSASVGWRVLARIAIVAYWLLLWFGLALSA